MENTSEENLPGGLSDFEGYYFKMLDGLFFTEVRSTPDYTIAWHEKTSDFYSNLAGVIRSPVKDAAALICETSNFFSERGRNPAIYLTPFTQPSDLREAIVKQGFSVAYRDAWMFYRAGSSLLQLPADVKIEAVGGPETMRVFVDTFNRAYSGTDPKEPYGAAPPAWGEQLFASFGRIQLGREVEYLLLWEHGQPAAVSLSVSIGALSGIYSIGTAPEFRGRGYGSAITNAAVKRLMQRGARTIFLQTEQGSYNERFYTKLGFKTEWVAEAWCRIG